MFADLLLRDANPKLMHDEQGYSLHLGVRLNWYRSVPLSCVESLELRLDNGSIPPVNMSLHLADNCICVSELQERNDVWWFPLDKAVLVARLEPSFEVSEHNSITYGIRIRVPYFLPRQDGTWATINDTSTIEVNL